MLGYVDKIDPPQNSQSRLEADASNRRFDRQRSLASLGVQPKTGPSLGVLAKTGLNLTMK